jgi:hypothetical protein
MTWCEMRDKKLLDMLVSNRALKCIRCTQVQFDFNVIMPGVVEQFTHDDPNNLRPDARSKNLELPIEYVAGMNKNSSVNEVSKFTQYPHQRMYIQVNNTWKSAILHPSY